MSLADEERAAIARIDLALVNISAGQQRTEDAVASLRVRVNTLEARAAMASAGLGAGTSAVVYALIQAAAWAAGGGH